jgi:hypothetical protein
LRQGDLTCIVKDDAALSSTPKLAIGIGPRDADILQLIIREFEQDSPAPTLFKLPLQPPKGR